MRKFIVISIPIVTLIFFILIMLSNNFLTKPLGKEESISQEIEKVIEEVKNERWEEASIETDRLKDTWMRVVKRIQFSSERDEINSLNVNIARLRGAIMVKDKASALMELYEAYEHWNDLGK